MLTDAYHLFFFKMKLILVDYFNISIYLYPEMKICKFISLMMAFIIVISFGCDTSLGPLDWEDAWNIEQVCYSIKNQNTNQPIADATLSLIKYNHPDCITCPLDLNQVSDTKGDICINASKGWTCESAVVSAEGYITLTITGKPPITLYLTPL
jgi:hypothetical protein